MKYLVLKLVLIGLVLVCAVYFVFFKAGSPSNDEQLEKIKVTYPVANQIIQNPLTITGVARGNWYFEASFPIKIIDAHGNILGSTFAQAQSDWMTENFVPFSANLSFSLPTTTTGTLVFEKDNPSGLPQFNDEFRLPIQFQLPTRSVQLYYYNENLDKDTYGNILCSKKGLVPINREIPVSKTPIQDTVRLLLQGNLTATERTQGISTEFPLIGFELRGASLNNGSLILNFDDPQNKTTGGSCRVSVLWFQIEATAKQFKEVKNVQFKPEELFQP